MKTNKVLLFVSIVTIIGIGIGYGIGLNSEDTHIKDENILYLVTNNVTINGDKNMTVVCDFVITKNPFKEYNEGKYINCTNTGGDNYYRITSGKVWKGWD